MAFVEHLGFFAPTSTYSAKTKGLDDQLFDASRAHLEKCLKLNTTSLTELLPVIAVYIRHVLRDDESCAMSFIMAKSDPQLNNAEQSIFSSK